MFEQLQSYVEGSADLYKRDHVKCFNYFNTKGYKTNNTWGSITRANQEVDTLLQTQKYVLFDSQHME